MLVADETAECRDSSDLSRFVADVEVTVGTAVVSFHDLWERAHASVCVRFASPTSTYGDATLCYCYTGGTTKASRCARVSHSMALHEIDAYPRIAPECGCEDRVFQQHSLYWAASAFGEVDIALAFGCALVFCESWDVEGTVLSIKEHEVTVAGLVPSVLAALQHSDVPTLKLVFTWGEALQTRVAQEWARTLHLVDLLISTECWLSLYADWSAEERCKVGEFASGVGRAGEADAGGGALPRRRDGPPFQVLPGTSIRLRRVDEGEGGVAGGVAVDGGSCIVGELLVSGPMVSPGYTDVALDARSFETDANGTKWFCTKDCLERTRLGNGFFFAGRSDDLVKVGGLWVDASEVETRLTTMAGVAEACIFGRHVHVTLKSPLIPSTLSTVKAALPEGFTLFVVPAPLPLNAGTGKVDRRRLAELSVGCNVTSNITEHHDREASLCVGELEAMLTWYSPLSWVGIACLFHAARRSWPGGSIGLSNAQEELLRPLCLGTVAEIGWRLPALSFMLLASWDLPSWAQSFVSSFPHGAPGACVFSVCVLPSPFFGVFAAAPGMFAAARRRRFISWPLVCAVGFPAWTRDARQPLHRWIQVGSQSGRAFVQSCKLKWQKLAGQARCCTWCKKHCLSSQGHIDPCVDGSWYCSACWSSWERHRQCPDCSKWFEVYSLDGIEAKLCQRCALTQAKSTKVRAVAAEQWKDVEWRTISFSCCNGSTSSIISTGSGRLSECDYAGGRDLAKADGSCRTGESSTLEELASPRLQEKSREWRIIEQATSISFQSTSDSLACLDSLRQTKLTSALRRETGKRVSRDALRRASSLGDLLTEIASLPVENTGSLEATSRRGGVTDFGGSQKQQQQRGMAGVQGEFAIWGLMWFSKCQWVLRRSKPLQVDIFRDALAELVEMHVALRAELRDPYRLFCVTQQAFSIFELWRRYGSHLALAQKADRAALAVLGPSGQHIVRQMAKAASGVVGCAVRWSFKHAWPRVAARQRSVASANDALVVRGRVASLKEAQEEVHKPIRDGFQPPFKVVLVPYGDPGKHEAEGALLRIMVTHMLSDGYCIVPLLSDLAHLVAAAESARDGCAEEGAGRPCVAALPPVLNMFAAIEPRLASTIDGVDEAHGITRNPLWRNWKTEAHTVISTLPAEVVGAIRWAANRMAVPEDVAMLTLVGTTLAWFQDRESVLFAMVVPQRDGPAENDMIGLFADIRHLVMQTGGLNFVGAAMRLLHDVQERNWRAPGLATQSDVPFVNFEWTDLEELQGFSQHVRVRNWGESARHPVQISVEQIDRASWRMTVSFSLHRYYEQDRNKFFTLFERCLQAMLERPLDKLWPCNINDSLPDANSSNEKRLGLSVSETLLRTEGALDRGK
eukprot:TRINITY_DN18474_c0_g1_i1.p1 TRINITY_DN18474_c0_g1~~TRINITY_DN18474_c0_g1_i1.p1  ORF type:complete len:1546 (-),score=234.08 TRINITY_DN18474_c0_g1_i1:137-4243(-)